MEVFYMDLQSFFKMNYGLYIVTSQADGQRAGCVVNTLSQVTAEPPKLTVAVSKQNVTTDVIRKAERFVGAVLGKEADMPLIGRFGFRSSRDLDKFDGISYAEDEAGIPYPTDHIVARYSCRVVDEVDLGTHVLFVAEVEEAVTLSEEEPMTYAYYHAVKKGKTPKNAPSYKPEEKKGGWRCTVCGYQKEGSLPAGFKCPLCGAGVDKFERVQG